MGLGFLFPDKTSAVKAAQALAKRSGGWWRTEEADAGGFLVSPVVYDPNEKETDPHDLHRK